MAIGSGIYYESALRQQLGDGLFPFTSQRAMFQALAEGSVDVAMAALPNGNYWVRELRITGVSIAGETELGGMSGEDLRFGVRAGSYHNKEPDMSDLKARFDEAVNYIHNAEGDFQPSNEMKLKFYGLHKQATSGDVTGKRPGMMDFVNRAKYDAWEKLRGTSSGDAMQQYIDRLNKLK